MKQPQLNTTSVYRRLSQIGLSVGLLVVVLTMWVQTNAMGEKIQSNSTSTLTRHLAKQSSMAVLRLMKKKQIKSLALMLDDLTTDPFIVHGMVYDKTGKIIAQSNNAVTAHESHLHSRAATLVETPKGVPISLPVQTKMYVSEIMDGDKLLGYLRISFLQQQALKAPLHFHKTIMRKILLMMILSGVIGFMLTRGFARFSRNSYRIVDK